MKSIKEQLVNAGKAGLPLSRIAGDPELDELLASGEAVRRHNTVYDSRAAGYAVCEVSAVHKTFGFVRDVDTMQEYFVPGRYFMAAMPQDRVLVQLHPGRGDSPEGIVMKVLEEKNPRFTGKIVLEQGELMVQPDTFVKFPMRIRRSVSVSVRVGQKVVCDVAARGERHSSHFVRVIEAFGDSQSAAVCANAVLAVYDVSEDFPAEVISAAEKIEKRGISADEMSARVDLRNLPIFTIDGADTKDIDDAISLSKEGEFYHLGVHIADVSHYVTAGSVLDKEAFRRGTSIYYANKVIPMLPKALSNGICSLNPKEDRLAFSCRMTIDKFGKVTDYRFEKSVIRSRVKGVYSEINALLAGDADDSLKEKYAEVLPTLPLMSEIFTILRRAKEARGVPELETGESKIIIDENDRAVDIVPCTRGVSEEMIEEFMLLANGCAANFARVGQFPFVYRVHETPPLEKIDTLREIVQQLGLSAAMLEGDVSADKLSCLLEEARETPYRLLVNRMVLRSMAKAKYSDQPLGHYGLVLRDYAHFTSPIRRYPDLMIHRILTDRLAGLSSEELTHRYGKRVTAAANQSSQTELTATLIERACEDCYKAEFMKSHVDEEFDGVISSAAPHGMYVELPNTVEGLVRADTLPDRCKFDGLIGFRPEQSGRSFRVGDAVRIRCTGVDVNAGHIDFVLVL